MKTPEIGEQLRKFVRRGSIEKVLDKTIQVADQPVYVSNSDGKGVRFDLSDLDTAFVLMSGRFYQRDFDSEAIYANPTGVVQQKNYHGELEPVDPRLFTKNVFCKCGDVRWVKNADLFQVTCASLARIRTGNPGGG